MSPIYQREGIIGEMKEFGGTIPPSGWLLCDGSAISREEYAVLFAAIGTTNGDGDGSTTFDLPWETDPRKIIRAEFV